MDFARTTLGKQARPAASASATSRKNKLQRCSVCGGLGHKSRTCDQALNTQDLSDCLDDRRRSDSPTLSSDSDDTPADALDVRAAYCLLNFSAEKPIDLSALMPAAPAPRA